jgi:TAT (twin-arginine translocation) pathway signal sequence.
MINRRSFLKGTLAGAAVAAASPHVIGQAKPRVVVIGGVLQP